MNKNIKINNGNSVLDKRLNYSISPITNKFSYQLN